MPYPLLKSENYLAVGGLNTKASLYITGEGEFINLQNVDFRTPGALSSFAGSTLFVTAGATSVVNGIAPFQLSTLNSQTGLSLSVVTTDAYNVSSVTGGSFVRLLPYIYPGTTAPMSMASGGSMLTGCNGYDFWGFFGSSLGWQFSMGKPLAILGAGVSTLGFSTVAAGPGGLTGSLVMYYSLIRSDGFIGPALAVSYPISGASVISIPIPQRPNLSVGGGAGLSFGSFGASGIIAWARVNNGLPVAYGSSSAAGVTLLPFGLTTGGVPSITFAANYTATGWWVTTPQPDDYQGSFAYAPSGQLQGGGYFAQDPGGFNGPYNPKVCVAYQNRLFTANHYQFPSRVVFSRPGNIEKAELDSFFDVGIKDPAGVVAMADYFTQLAIFKRRSTWALSGSGPDTFVLSQVSDIYGCISKNAVVVWNQNCWFLDEKGIFEFNGANVQCVSNKVDDYFQRMNTTVAANTAVMVHVKERNEVWCAIPIDGAAFNNLIIVYDYLAQAWTTRTTPPGDFSALAVVAFGTTKPTVYYGASGQIGTFGSSLVGDNGQPFTCVIQSRYVAGEFGNSVTKQYRRLFVDAAIPAGMTYPILVNFYADKGVTPYSSVTMILTGFQDRIDFGIPAKSVSAEIIYNGASFFQFNGFTIDYRFQRAC